MGRLRTGSFVFVALLFVQSLVACGGHDQATPGVASLERSTTRRAPAASSPSSAYFDAVIASAPAAYFRLDDTGTAAVDSSANHLSGTIGAGVVRNATGLLGSSSDTALSFPGTQSAGGAIVVPQTKILQPQTQVSVELFLRFSKTPSNFAVPISYGSDSTDAPYDLYFLGSGKVAAQFTLSTGVAVWRRRASCSRTRPTISSLRSTARRRVSTLTVRS